MFIEPNLVKLSFNAAGTELNYFSDAVSAFIAFSFMTIYT